MALNTGKRLPVSMQDAFPHGCHLVPDSIVEAMDYDEATRGHSVFTRVDGLAQVTAYARLVADGADPSDLPPLACER